MERFNDALFLDHAITTVNQLHNGVMLIDLSEDGNVSCRFYNEYIANVLGYTKDEIEEIISVSPMNLLYPADHEKIISTIQNASFEKHLSCMGRLVHKDGHFIWFLGHYQRFIINHESGIIIYFTNVDEIIGLQKQYESDSLKWMNIVNSVPVALIIFSQTDNASKIIGINDTMINFSNKIGQYLDGNARSWTKEELTLIFNQSIFAFCTNEDVPIVQEMMKKSHTEKFTYCLFRLRGSSDQNSVFIYSSCTSQVNEDGSRTYYITFQDVTENERQKKEIEIQQEELLHLSYFDSLTGCKNRNAYNAYIDYCKTHRLYNVGIAFADVNGLKRTNDALGHGYGDKMLIKFARILGEYFSSNNIFRISGDEFVVIEPEISKAEFQERMRHVIDNCYANENVASIGYIWKDNVSDLKRRSNQAEKIMYVEKQRYYEANQTVISKHRPVLLNTLLVDLRCDRYVMYLQPKSKIGEKKACGAEALIRKVDDDGAIIPPYEFIPQLERERLIPKIDFFMLEKVCEFLAELKKAGNNDFKVSVNMSRVTLVENDYINTISSICDRYDFNRNQLEFEVTESNETLDQIRLEDYIKQIKALGISISLDDVGTDYSSLTMLLLNGVDTVKLDRSLIIRLKNEKAQKLLSHIIRMSHDLGLNVIAEGVETDEDRLLLESMNCDMYQGYLMSKPISKADFIEQFLTEKIY